MPKKITVTIYKSGNMIFLDPTTDRIFNLIKPALSFVERQMTRGAEARRRSGSGQSAMNVIHHTLLEIDHKERIATTFGFWKLIRDTLRAEGYEVKFNESFTNKQSKIRSYCTYQI